MFPIKPDEFIRRANAKQKSDVLAGIGLMAAIFLPLCVLAIIYGDAPAKPFQIVALLAYMLFCVWFFLRIVYKTANCLGVVCPKCRAMFNVVSTAKTRRCNRCGAQIVEEPG